MKLSDLEVKIGGVKFQSPIMNAACECKDWPQVQNLARSASAAVTLGSITVEPKEGNSGDTYRSFEGFSINSRGLPNRGLDYYLGEIDEMTTLCHEAEYPKPLIVSLAGMSKKEFDTLIIKLDTTKADFKEINYGCPNVLVEGVHKPIFAYDAEFIDQTLWTASKNGVNLSRFLVKVSPYLLFGLIEEVARVLSKYPIAGVTSCNTIPNGRYFLTNGRDAIGPKFGGIGGTALLGPNLGQVSKLRELLPSRIKIIAAGGISTGEHMLAYLRAGATAVQVATAYVDEGPDVFSRILSEYIELVEKQERKDENSKTNNSQTR